MFVANWIGGLSLGWWCDVSLIYGLYRIMLIQSRTITSITVSNDTLHCQPRLIQSP